MDQVRFPSLYQINTRIWLYELARQLGRPAILDQVPDAALDHLARLGFDWIWLLGVWQTGPAGQRVSASQPQWQREFHDFLPDFTDADVCGSPFAIQSYTVHTDFGGNEALARLRQKLRQRGLRLLLDFVPNHVALDHPWVEEHPEYFIQGTEADLVREPQNYCRLTTQDGPLVLARGRDPYFPGWPDTLQLNYRHAGLRAAMIGELTKVSRLCDGVRCDMAMLLLPDVFIRTWGQASVPAGGIPPVDAPFWPKAIAQVRQERGDFLLMAEVYWDLEWKLQQQGFDYTYDKRLYDRLHVRDAEAVRSHLLADLEFQSRSVRFLENHDEPRAASAFPAHIHRAAAMVAYLVPGLRLFHEGQLEGRRSMASMHLRRRPDEPVDVDLQQFYQQLLTYLTEPELRGGRWQLLRCRPAWEDNPTWKRFLAFSWEPASAGQGLAVSRRLLVTVNYGWTRGQCFVTLPFADLRGKKFLLRDRMSPARHEREGDDLAGRGLYLDMPEWGYHLFEMVAT